MNYYKTSIDAFKDVSEKSEIELFLTDNGFIEIASDDSKYCFIRFSEKLEMIDFEKKFLGPITHKNYISLKDWITAKINYEDKYELLFYRSIDCIVLFIMPC